MLPVIQGRSVSRDAPDNKVGFVLERSDVSGDKRKAVDEAQNLNKAECNYSTTGKECLAA